MDSCELLVHFVSEREKVRMLKESGAPRPWTSDPILQKYKFCNIRRADDRVTKWIMRNLVVAPGDDIWFTLLIARLVNWPPALEELIACGVLPTTTLAFEPQALIDVMQSRAERGDKCYTGAFMIYPPKTVPGSKIQRLCKVTLVDAISRSARLNAAARSTVQEFTTELAGCYGLNTFMAGQVAADLTYIPGYLYEAPDLYTWAPRGPGSMVGLNYFYGRSSTAMWDEEEFIQGLLDVMMEVSKIPMPARMHPLTLHDIQNVMCEFGKYAKMHYTDVRPKITYTPEQEF